LIIRIIAMSLLLTFAASAEPVSVNDISVVDGDTIDYHGERYRMIGYDTPEISTPRRKVSADEKALATLAKERFVELLKSGPLDLTEVRCSCSESKIGTKQCNNGRKCGLLTLNGKNIGDILIAEELAMPFVCGKSRCPRMPDWPRIIEGYSKWR
jgi:endonuclease YncB( thermonuclease family)